MPEGPFLPTYDLNFIINCSRVLTLSLYVVGGIFDLSCNNNPARRKKFKSLKNDSHIVVGT